MQITPLGDSALLVRVPENFDNAPEDALSKVLATKSRLAAAKIPGAIEITAAYTTVALFYDPICAIDAGATVENVFGWFEQRIREALSDDKNRPFHHVERSMIQIPVCYEIDFAPD